MKRNKIYMMCMILAGILFFGSVGAIVRICMSYREGEQVYEELEEYIREPESTKEPEEEESTEETFEVIDDIMEKVVTDSAVTQKEDPLKNRNNATAGEVIKPVLYVDDAGPGSQEVF